MKGMFDFFKKKKNGKTEAVKQNAKNVLVEIDGEEVSVHDLLLNAQGADADASQETEIEFEDSFKDANGDEHSMNELIAAYRENKKKMNADDDDEDDDKDNAKDEDEDKENASDDKDEDKENEGEEADEEPRPAKKKASKKKENTAPRKDMKHFVKLNSAREEGLAETTGTNVELINDKLNRGREMYGSAKKS